jgi:hypothetical protein
MRFAKRTSSIRFSTCRIKPQNHLISVYTIKMVENIKQREIRFSTGHDVSIPMAGRLIDDE